jgi:diguanylate cyclase (GGDEF)-like protein
VSLVPPAESHAIDLHGGALLALIDLAASTDPAHGRSLHALVGAALDAIGAEAAIVLDDDAVVLAVPERLDCGELKRAGRLADQAGGRSGLVSTVPLGDRSNRRLAIRWREQGPQRHDLVAAVDELVGPVAEPFPVARVDALTGLPDRVATLQHLDEALHRARRAGRPVGVLYIDLDGFKAVNDAFGHANGDRALSRAARSMREALRRGDVVGRVGGDEFLAVIDVVADESEIADAAERFVKLLQIGVEFDGATRQVAASVGIAVAPHDGDDAQTLLACADAAMYAAKKRGGRGARWYRDGVGEALDTRRALRESLRSSDRERDFLLCLQPIVAASDQRVVGLESLVRYRHPVRGWLSPRGFMDGGLSPETATAIDSWVIEELAELAERWGEAHDLRLHVNLSGFDDALLGDLIGDTVMAGAYGSGFLRRLAVEVQESAILADPVRARNAFEALTELGATTVIDGFGADRSSLAVLATLRIGGVKLDPSLTQGVAGDEVARRKTRAAIAMARALGAVPSADGVATQPQAQWLAENGVEELQGYWFAQPMVAPDCAAWLGSPAAQPASRR